MSPTVLRDGPYRFIFFSNERGELPHVHEQRDACLARFRLAPVTLARSTGLSHRELRTIAALVNTNADPLMEAWHAHLDA